MSPKKALTKIQAILLIIVVIAVVAGAIYSVYHFYIKPAGVGEVIPSEIKVGTVLPLSGPFSVEGSAALLGMQVAVKWVNDHGGVSLGGKQVPLRLIYYDDQGNPDLAVKMTEKLVAEDKVHIVIHTWGFLSDFTPPVTERAGVFSILWAGGAENHIGQGFKYMTSYHSQLVSFYKNVLRIIRDADPNAKTVALIWRSQPGIELWTMGARRYAAEYGFNLIYDRGYPPDITDASPILREIEALKPDILLIACYPPDGYVITTQLRDLRVNIKWVSAQVIVNDPEFGEAFNKWAVGFLVDSFWEPEVDWRSIAMSKGIEFVGATNEELLSIYRQLGGKGRPGGELGTAAAGVFLFAKIVEVAQSLDPDRLIEAAKMVDVYTCRGRFKVDPKEPLRQLGLDAPPIVVQWQRKDNKLTYEILYPYEMKTSNPTPMPTWEEKEKWPTLQIELRYSR
ncbi:MAG: ABC transporter substrate-binding protein [Candidatus Bathyarchaeia archaeon]